MFEPFPFPNSSEAEKNRIRAIAEKLDEHRKRQQSQHLDLTLTGICNVLEKLTSGEVLTAKEKVIYEQGLVSVLKQLQDELDLAVGCRCAGFRARTNLARCHCRTFHRQGSLETAPPADR